MTDSIRRRSPAGQALWGVVYHVQWLLDLAWKRAKALGRGFARGFDRIVWGWTR